MVCLCYKMIYENKFELCYFMFYNGFEVLLYVKILLLKSFLYLENILVKFLKISFNI